MNITFLIGNGFDINLGLKTRYVDFYDFFLEHASTDSIILKLMKEDNNKENWSDLESALGEKLKDVSEENVDSFMDSHTELDALLLDYLEAEQKKYNAEKLKEEILSELGRSLKELPEELSIEEQSLFQTIFDEHRNGELQYNFITFNYTDILDEFIKMAKADKIDLGAHTSTGGQIRKHSLGEVHHVHGSLMEGVVLGVNDESQINNEIFRQHGLFKNVFLKSNINRQMGQRRTERAEEIIDKSQIICIFGMSMGITDMRWWEKIIVWLLANSHRILIIYTRADEKQFKRRIPTLFIREREKIRQEFWRKGHGNNPIDVYSKISSRLFVVFNSKIFSFPYCLKCDKTREEVPT